jgi:NADH-quinone oxidoreductase subunit M
VSITISLDGLSLLFLALTGLLGCAAILASWKEHENSGSGFYLALCLALAGINGVFLATDLFLFVFMWELMLVPMYFLIDLWGHEGRHRAAVKFFVFTQAGGLLMLIAVISLYLVHGSQTGLYTFDYDKLMGTSLPPLAERLVMLGFFAAFAVKLPAFGLHAWLPDAHTEAPTAGSVILAGLLLKTGGYGLLRFVLPLFPSASRDFAPVAMWIGVAGILYGAVLALGQTDMKRLVAYTSVSHLGFVLLGIYTLSDNGRNGAVIQMLSHGLGTGALFILVGSLQERLHTRDIRAMGGLWSAAPRMGAIALVLTLGLVGLPGMGGFVGEYLVLVGAYGAGVLRAAVASLGLALAMAYALRMYQTAFHGKVSATLAIRDLSARELALLCVLAVALIVLGLSPGSALGALSGLAAGGGA